MRVVPGRKRGLASPPWVSPSPMGMSDTGSAARSGAATAIRYDIPGITSIVYEPSAPLRADLVTSVRVRPIPLASQPAIDDQVRLDDDIGNGRWQVIVMPDVNGFRGRV